MWLQRMPEPKDMMKLLCLGIGKNVEINGEIGCLLSEKKEKATSALQPSPMAPVQ